MKKKFSFGKVDLLGIGRKTCPVVVEVELRETDKGPELSIRGNILNHISTDCYVAGQCLDTIADFVKNPLFKELYRFWQLYHLNGLHAGTVDQEHAIEEWKKLGNKYDYTAVCEYLKSIGLYEVMHEGKLYRYGSGWLYRPIPENDLNRIKEILA